MNCPEQGPVTLQKPVLLTGFLIFFLASLALTANTLWFHYQGNNYFPPEFFSAATALLLMYLGCRIQWDGLHRITVIVRELFVFFVLLSSIALLTNATQYTPFPLIDSYVIRLEQQLHIDTVRLIAWTARHPYVGAVLNFSYNSLLYQIILLPLGMIFLQRQALLRDYYFLLLVTALIGFGIYYFFPTTAPASHFDSPFFQQEQRDTGIKFIQIHAHQPVTTQAGGLIAFPSFHAIWAILCLYLIRHYRLLFAALLPLNLLLLVSCLLLGWHYALDLLGAITVCLFAWCLLQGVKKRSFRHLV